MEPLATGVRLVDVHYSVTLLLHDDCKCVLVTVDWLTQSELEEVLWLFAHESASRRDLVVLANVSVKQQTADPEARQIVVQVDPKVPRWKLVVEFSLLRRSPL